MYDILCSHMYIYIFIIMSIYMYIYIHMYIHAQYTQRHSILCSLLAFEVICVLTRCVSVCI